MGKRIELPPPPPDIKLKKLSESINLFLKALEASGANPRTLKPYRAALKSFISIVGDKPVSEINTGDYFKWLIEAKGRAIRFKSEDDSSRQTTIHYYSLFIRRFLKWLGIGGEFPVVPKTKRGFSATLKWSDVEALIRAARSIEEALVVAILAETGMRVNELLSIRVSDIDLASGEVKIRGKYGKERVVYLGPLSKVLLEYYLSVKRLRAGDKLLHITYQGVYKMLKRMARRAGIDESKVKPHALRHAFATEAIRRGMSLPALQKILGHTDIKVTELYLHLVNEDVKREYEKIFYGPRQEAPSANPLTALPPHAYAPQMMQAAHGLGQANNYQYQHLGYAPREMSYSSPSGIKPINAAEQAVANKMGVQPRPNLTLSEIEALLAAARRSINNGFR